MKKLITLMLASVMLMSSVSAADLYVNGQPTESDVGATVINGVELAPARTVFRKLGMTVTWENGSAVADGDGFHIVAPVGSDTVTVNGNPVTLSQPVQIVKGRTMLPVSFFRDVLGSTVSWTEDTAQTADPTAAARVKPVEEYYIFDLSDNVTREHVYYRNRYGIELAGDLYMAKDADRSQKYPALVIGPPFGGVKEQGPGVYANQLAQRGFVVLTFDPSYHGYSGGQPRMTGSTDIYAADFSAGVDYLTTRAFVDSERIGAIGICASGGFVLGAAAQDARIKAVATSVMYDISSFGNGTTGEARRARLEELSRQRTADAASGTAAYTPIYPEQPIALEDLPDTLTGNDPEFWSFYATKRGWHFNARGNVTATSDVSLMSFPSLTHIAEIAPRPILFIVGENAHSKMFTETAYAAAAEPKELYTVPDAIHIDLYDDVTKIPFDKLESFFKDNLSK